MDQPISERATETQSKALWAGPFVAILFGHWFIDSYSFLVPSSLGVIQREWSLTDKQAAWFLGIGSLMSGLAQPIFAWISDRLNSRICGGLGLFLGAGLIANIGWAHSPWTLFLFYIVGMIGIGMFHPIGASTIGQLMPNRRSLAVSLFFVAGMIGGMTGSFFGPRLLVTEHGFQILSWLAIPGIIFSFVLYRQIANVTHRSSTTLVEQVDGLKDSGSNSPWLAVFLLYVSSAARVTVNMALVYLYVRWTEGRLAALHPEMSEESITSVAAPLYGNLNAATIAGMAVGGLAAGLLIKPGYEKKPLVLVPLLLGPAIYFFPIASQFTACLLSFCAGIAFASMVPITLAAAQRLIPHRSSLASGIMLGGAWAIGLIGPAAADWIINVWDIDTAFYATATVLVLSGIVVIPLNVKTIRSSALAHYH